jgi:hypothetical protein
MFEQYMTYGSHVEDLERPALMKSQLIRNGGNVILCGNYGLDCNLLQRNLEEIFPAATGRFDITILHATISGITSAER